MRRSHVLSAFAPLLFACSPAEAPPAVTVQAAPQVVAAPTAPAIATVPGLSPALTEALGRLRGLFADPNDAAIQAAFSPTFLASVPADQVKTVFAQARAGVGACTEQRPMTVKSETTTVIHIQCERGALTATLVVNPAPPHLVEGLLIKPAGP
jgi:hypothetical protein